MFPKNKKVSRKLFPLFLGKSRKFENSLFLVRLVENKKNGSRFCFSVSRKIVKSAVVRNRIKRSGYKFLTECADRINRDCLLNFFFKRMPKNNEEIKNSIESILLELKIILPEIKR